MNFAAPLRHVVCISNICWLASHVWWQIGLQVLRVFFLRVWVIESCSVKEGLSTLWCLFIYCLVDDSWHSTLWSTTDRFWVDCQGRLLTPRIFDTASVLVYAAYKEIILFNILTWSFLNWALAQNLTSCWQFLSTMSLSSRRRNLFSFVISSLSSKRCILLAAGHLCH